MSEELIDFPLDFPIKVMGRAEPGFRELVMELVEAHAGPLDSGRISTRESRDGNFVAYTLNVYVENRAQLDAIYRSLSGHERVLMVL